MAHSIKPSPLQWPIAHKKIGCSGQQHRRTLKVEYLCEFESILETVFDHKSGDQLGTFDKIMLHIKNITILSL
jgi:hypothetical protein